VGLAKAVGYDGGMVSFATPDPPHEPREWTPHPRWLRPPLSYIRFPLWVLTVGPVLVLASPIIAIAWLVEKRRSKKS
jgi:hypothetical protein